MSGRLSSSNAFSGKMDDMIPNLRDRNVQSAVKNLVTYSLVILFVPLGSMFFLKAFLFERRFRGQ